MEAKNVNGRLAPPARVTVPRRYLVKVPRGLGYKQLQRERGSTAKAVIAEFLGTMLLVLVGTAATLSLTSSTNMSRVAVALAMGLTVASVMVITDHVSGGHLNPCVTLALLLIDKLKFVRAILFIIAQCVGAIAGAGILYGVMPETSSSQVKFNATLTVPDESITPIQAAGIELMSSLIFVLVVLAIKDEFRGEFKGSGPLAAGLAMSACLLAFSSYTWPSINPARSFGPAVIANAWTNHWVYWVGPMCASVVAAFFYAFVFGAEDYLPRADDTGENENPAVLELADPEVDVITFPMTVASEDVVDAVAIPIENQEPVAQTSKTTRVDIERSIAIEHLPPELGPNEREIK